MHRKYLTGAQRIPTVKMLGDMPYYGGNRRIISRRFAVDLVAVLVHNQRKLSLANKVASLVAIDIQGAFDTAPSRQAHLPAPASTGGHQISLDGSASSCPIARHAFASKPLRILRRLYS